MVIVGEFFQFCNDLIAGGPPPINEDIIPSIIRSETTQKALQQVVSNIINTHSSIIDQSLIADKKIKVDCGNRMLTPYHLELRKKEYTWYGGEIKGSGCPSFGCCYDVSQNSQITLSAVNSTVIKDTRKMYNDITQELENQVTLTMQGNKDSRSKSEKLMDAMKNVKDVDGDGVISKKERRDQILAAFRPPTSLTKSSSESENTSIQNIERVLKNLTKTDVEMSQNIDIVSLSPLACVNKCNEPPSAGKINQSLNIEIASKNIVSMVTETIITNHVEMTSTSTVEVADVDMRKIYIFAIIFVLFVVFCYILVYLLLAGLLIVTLLLKKPEWLTKFPIIVHLIAVIISYIIWLMWSVILCMSRSDGALDVVMCLW
jgi:hypothetical protein